LGYTLWTPFREDRRSHLATQINKTKVLGELFQLVVMINDKKLSKEYHRLLVRA